MGIIILLVFSLFFSFTACKNPLQAIIALDVFKPDIAIKVGDTEIPSGEGTYTFVGTPQGTIVTEGVAGYLRKRGVYRDQQRKFFGFYFVKTVLK